MTDIDRVDQTVDRSYAVHIGLKLNRESIIRLIANRHESYSEPPQGPGSDNETTVHRGEVENKNW
jgi:hypothetical protein